MSTRCWQESQSISLRTSQRAFRSPNFTDAYCASNTTKNHPPRHRNYKSTCKLNTTITHPLTTCQLRLPANLFFQEGASSRTSYAAQTPMCRKNGFARQFFYLSQGDRAKAQKGPQTLPRPPVQYAVHSSQFIVHSSQ